MDHSNETIAAAVKAAWRTDDAAALADGIGPLDRDAYRTLVADWKADYAAMAAEIRDARSKRKGDGGYWQSVRQMRRHDARRMMAVRMAIRELGRRHWQARQALAA